MKKLLLLLFSLLLNINHGVIAQNFTSQIEGFWNIKLGESKNIVVNKIKQKYPDSFFNRNEEMIINNCSLAGNKGSMVLKFTDNELSEGNFIISTQASTFTSAQSAKNFVNQNKKIIMNYFEQYFEAFYEKYGEPSMIMDQSVIWKSSNNNKIKITLYFSDGYNPYSMFYYGDARLTVSYLNGNESIDY